MSQPKHHNASNSEYFELFGSPSIQVGVTDVGPQSCFLDLLHCNPLRSPRKSNYLLQPGQETCSSRCYQVVVMVLFQSLSFLHSRGSKKHQLSYKVINIKEQYCCSVQQDLFLNLGFKERTFISIVCIVCILCDNLFLPNIYTTLASFGQKPHGQNTVWKMDQYLN